MTNFEITDPKISPFQLMALLLACRIVALLLWTPRQPLAGSMLLAGVLALPVQFYLMLGLRWLVARATASGSQLWHRAVAAGSWLACMATAAVTAQGMAVFLSGSYYHDRYGVVLLLVLLGCCAAAAVLGLEGFCRAAPLLLAFAAVGVLLLLAGAVPGMHLRYLPPLTVTAEGTAELVFAQTLSCFELLGFALLSPYSVRPVKKRAIAVWLGLAWAVSVSLALAVMLCLGRYAQGQRFPVYTLARTARLLFLEQMDALLLWLWVVLGFLRCTLALFLASEQYKQLFSAKPARIRPLWQGGIAAVAALLLLVTGCAGEPPLGSKKIITLLELEPRDGQLAVRAEYRKPPTADETKPAFGVCAGSGDDLWQALGNLEQTESGRLYLENCRVVALTGQLTMEQVAALLEQLSQAGVRPLTLVVATAQPLLQATVQTEQSTAAELTGMTARHGGQLGGSFTLKDALASLRDPLLPLLLPCVAPGEQRQTLLGFSLWQQQHTGWLSAEEAGLLPLWDTLRLERRLTLPGGGQLTLTDVVALPIIKAKTGEYTLTVVARAVLDGHSDRKSAAVQLEALLRDQLLTTLETTVKKDFIDIFGFAKVGMEENDKGKITILPIFSVR
ncbi:MAG: GerAB/ArcD/ProY family transporter [Angelakisella sp.]